MGDRGSGSFLALAGVVKDPREEFDLDEVGRSGLGKAEYEARVGLSRTLVRTTVPDEPAEETELFE